jgi:hypothetical protein
MPIAGRRAKRAITKKPSAEKDKRQEKFLTLGRRMVELDESGCEIKRHRYLEWQKDCLRAVEHDPQQNGQNRLWLPTGARAGKDRFMAQGIVDWAIQHGIKMQRHEQEHSGWQPLIPRVNTWFVAPTRKLYKQNWEEVNEAIPQSLVTNSNKQDGVVRLRGDVCFSFKSADHPETLVAEGLDFLGVTEASRIRSHLVWEESLLPRLSSPGRLGISVVNGTPRCGKLHWFRRSCDIAERLEREAKAAGLFPKSRVWQHPTWINPMMVDKIQGLRESMPERLFNSEIAAMWPDDEEKPFRDADVQALMCDGNKKPPVAPFYYAIDVARQKDWTWITRGGTCAETGIPQVIGMWGMRKKRINEQIERIKSYIEEIPGEVVVDSTAAGGMQFKDELERALGYQIVGYDFHGTRKEDLIESAIIAVEQKRFQFRTDLIEAQWLDEAVIQFSNFECEIEDNGRYVYHGEPDDAPVSVALLWYLAKWGLSGVGTSWAGTSYLEQLFA